MDFRHFLAMLFISTPNDVVLLVCIGVGGCVCPISSRVWHAVIPSRQLMKRAPSSASTADDMTAFIMCSTVRTAPLFGGSAELLDMEKCPPYSASCFGLRKVQGVTMASKSHVTGTVCVNGIGVREGVI